ncbi:MAG TPA: isochorismatase family cysteine hydrolase [Pyrinomonadaceae bacterium]|jgi:nicotinamidase-related amidase|nr:isochorismatase family cysteine hydrolase [Pyrinomonadaceae bacterium]
MAKDKSPDLHGNAPDNSSVALLLIDVINDFEFDEGADDLFRNAMPAARRIAALKRSATDKGIPAIYVNDNFGKWRSDFHRLVAHCIDGDTRGRPIAELLKPTDEDYFVLKPKQSGFYSTTLELLLEHLGARTLILTGFSSDICVLLTASDAHLRDFHLIIPCDCVASQSESENERALKYMERVFEADVRSSDEIDLKTTVRK